MKKKYYICIISVILLVFFDWLTKHLIVSSFALGKSIIIIKNFLKICYIKNYGASFGMLSGNTIILIALTILILVYLFKEIKSNKNNN